MSGDPDKLATIPLFEQLSDEQRGRVAAAGFERSYERGAIIFNEGETAEALFVVLAGQVKLMRYSSKGRELLLHLVHPGQTFAEAALFAGDTYPATAEVVEPARVWYLPRAALIVLLRGSPELALAMLGSVSMWTRRLASKLELLTQRRVEERLALYLLALAGTDHPEPGATIELAQPRNLIAAQLGTGPEVLSRTFRGLQDDGIIAAAPRHVTVLDPAKLRALAEWIE
jgi:CRP/FNR family transcriptional regulator, dissimilatory nitrate respiration regulator